jgi:DNA-binding response OmpR family regulator
MRILVVEDKRSFALHISRALESEGHDVTLAGDGGEGLRMGLTANFDLVLLDVMLPRVNGHEVIRRIRNERLATQTIMVSARDSMQDIVDGLDAGADDYLTKPFALDVLLAKVRASERRIPTAPPTMLEFEGLQLRPHHFEAERNGRAIPLTRTEGVLLETLMRRPRTVVPHSVLIEQAWGLGSDVGSDNLYVFIRALRSKITHPGETELLHTVRGVGYCLRPDAA